MDGLLSEVISLQRDYVVAICSACKEPCCKKVEYLYDERDRIFLKVFLGEDLPRKRQGPKGCPFLLPGGCRLRPKARPFTCHRYLCPELERAMTQKEPGLPERLRRKFGILEGLRGQLWREYLDACLQVHEDGK